MIRAIIIDDEKSSQITLTNMVTNFCEGVEIVDTASSVSDGVRLINKHKPDLVFLDIEMPVEKGYKLFDYFESPDFSVLFTTAFQKYAVQAFRFSAVDYLLKPIELSVLREALEKVKNKREADLNKERLDILRENLNNVCSKLALPTNDGFHFVTLNDIIRCESQNNYTCFYFLDGSKILVSRTLKVFSKMLSDFNFFRISRSDLVNLNHIIKIGREKSPSLTMIDDTKLTISQRRKEEFLKVIRQI